MKDTLHPGDHTAHYQGWYLRILALCLILSIIFGTVPVLSEPGTPIGNEYPRTVLDDQHVLVTLLSPPQRIISLAPSDTEMLFALGLDERIVGDTDYCNYPSEAAQKEKIGGFSTVSLEKVLALNPDLVVAADGNTPETIDRIRSMGIPVYYADAKSLSDVQKTLKNLGDLTGVSKQAEQLNKNLTAIADTVHQEGENLSHHPTVAHVIWNNPIYVSGSGTFQDELIHLAGGVTAFGDAEGHHIVSVEEFVTSNPDILLINTGSGMGSEGGDLSSYFRSEPRLANLKAVKENHIITVNTDVADRAGPRLWDMLEEIAPKIREMG
ncbi:cobalamin-binding protein [uncultured Methanospirillum sp.]|uniref:ABC transporter substrate-binding protein n=1 Tax=uncultured Methanospirillum sp. TaxID=262503 RepID=UPI0029C6DCD3|nr:cobalamin-binding protein [uncultured Methanospirillum sp.]